jgi:GxxExxY protein
MNTNSHEEKWLHGDLVYNVIGSAIEVMKELGHGLHEKPYENAMVVEMGLRGLTWQQQPRYDVFYKGVLVSEYVPDLIVANAVVVDSKVIDRITDHERGQILNYLRITKLRVGLIINFKHAKLEWERMVL